MNELAAARTFFFGLALGAAVGPIALYVIHVGLTHGGRKALACALGVAAADFSYAFAAFTAAGGLGAWLEQYRGAFGAGTSALLVAVSIHLIRAAWSRPAPSPHAGRVAAPRAGFATTYLLTLANPLTIVLFVSFSGQLNVGADWLRAACYASLVFLGSLPVQAAYALLGAALHKTLSPSVVRRINFSSALAILAFGVYGIARALR